MQQQKSHMQATIIIVNLEKEKKWTKKLTCSYDEIIQPGWTLEEQK